MKILYTKKFKEVLSQPWGNISLGKVKLRGGTNTGLTRQDISKIIEIPYSFSVTESTQRTYNSEVIRLPKGGIQIYLDIPEEDQSFYSSEYYYQALLFFFTDLMTNKDSLAFVCYEDIKYLEGQETSPKDDVVFTGLTLNTRKNIITLPNFSWNCNISFSQSEVIKFLESSVGNLEVSPYSSGIGYASKDSWKAWIVDSLSEGSLTPWIETTYINKYGIKIY